MIKLKKCIFNNVLVFGNVEQTFNFRPGVFKITGQNRDKGGSNGAGKTSILNIITLALYGKPFEDEIEDIQNYTNSSKKTPAKISIYFEKNGVEYRIDRTKAGSSNSVSLFKKEDDWCDITLGKGVQATNAQIVEVIGFDFDMFCLSHIFSGNVMPFLKRSATEQRKIVETLFDASELSVYAEAAKTKKSEIESEIKVEEALKNSAEALAQKTRGKIVQVQRDIESWELDKKNKLAELDTLQKVSYDFTAEIEKFEFLSELKSIKSQEIAPQLNSVNEEILQNNRAMSVAADQLLHLQDGNCPFCKQAFSSAEKIKELEEEIKSKQEVSAELTSTKNELKLLYDDLTQQIEEVTNDLTFKSIQHLNQVKTQVENSEALRISLENSVNPNLSTLASLQQIETEHKDFDSSKLDLLKNELEHVKLLIQLLTNRDSIIRTSIISSQTALLNSRIQHYSKMLDLPQILHFDANMKCSVMEFGRSTSYGNLSAGEKRRANLSLSYAFRDLVMMKHGGINLLMIDEIDGGSLDQPACNSIVKSLYEVCGDSMILVISHNELVASKLSNEILVVKECGFSSIQ